MIVCASYVCGLIAQLPMFCRDHGSDKYGVDTRLDSAGVGLHLNDIIGFE